MYISGEKNLETIWKEQCPFTQSELKLIVADQTSESVTQTRFWRLRPDGLAFRLSTETKEGTLCILEFNRISDVKDQYLIRTRSREEDQYVSLRRSLGATLQHQGWKVEQISFIEGSRSLNKQDLRKNLKFFQVPEASIETIGSKLVMKMFDEYANILRCMYSTRFTGDLSRTGSSLDDHPIPETPTPSLIRSLESGRPDKFRKRTKGNKH